jgi:hypothetical protein
VLRWTAKSLKACSGAAAAYYRDDHLSDEKFDGGWLRTGEAASITRLEDPELTPKQRSAIRQAIAALRRQLKNRLAQQI